MKRFNIRVYGILINDKNEVLVTDEIRSGYKMTKFPGGGLEHGEGTIDCIKRECFEELNLEIEVKAHFYTTDYFQASAFNTNDQLISIYYLIAPAKEHNFDVKQNQFEFAEEIEGAQIFRWLSLKTITENDFTFPVDRRVANMLKNYNV